MRRKEVIVSIKFVEFLLEGAICSIQEIDRDIVQVYKELQPDDPILDVNLFLANVELRGKSALGI